jgi:hypothetical protein
VARYKLPERNGMLAPVVLEEQLHVGTFEWALHQLVDYELDFKALDDRFCNDQTGAPAYDPRTLIKSVLLGYRLTTCDRLGLIGKAMFAIDGVKLPCNASKERTY